MPTNNNVYSEGIFGDFSEKDLVKGLCTLITWQTQSLLQPNIDQNNTYKNIINPKANHDILFNIASPIMLGDFSEEALAEGIDKLIDIILNDHLTKYYKSSPLLTSSLGEFSEEDLTNGINKIINTRITESFFKYNNKTPAVQVPATPPTQSVNSTTTEYVYILYNDYSPNVYKIGWTARHPDTRAMEISQGTGVVGVWKVAHFWKVENGYWLEQRIFQQFNTYRLPRSEMFHIKHHTVEQVAKSIGIIISNTGESPKRAAEIAEKERQQKLAKIEAQAAYESQCQTLKDQISHHIFLLIDKEIKPIEESQKQNRVWYYVGVGIFLIPYYMEEEKNVLGGLIIGAILTWIAGFILAVLFQKDDRQQVIKNKYNKYSNLPSNLDHLKKIKQELNIN